MWSLKKLWTNIYRKLEYTLCITNTTLQVINSVCTGTWVSAGRRVWEVCGIPPPPPTKPSCRTTVITDQFTTCNVDQISCQKYLLMQSNVDLFTYTYAIYYNIKPGKCGTKNQQDLVLYVLPIILIAGGLYTHNSPDKSIGNTPCVRILQIRESFKTKKV